MARSGNRCGQGLNCIRGKRVWDNAMKGHDDL